MSPWSTPGRARRISGKSLFTGTDKRSPNTSVARLTAVNNWPREPAGLHDTSLERSRRHPGRRRKPAPGCSAPSPCGSGRRRRCCGLQTRPRPRSARRPRAARRPGRRRRPVACAASPLPPCADVSTTCRRCPGWSSYCRAHATTAGSGAIPRPASCRTDTRPLCLQSRRCRNAGPAPLPVMIDSLIIQDSSPATTRSEGPHRSAGANRHPVLRAVDIANTVGWQGDPLIK
jgi:hypothetical protein